MPSYERDTSSYKPLRKTLTFDGTSVGDVGTDTLFTVNGKIEIGRIVPHCTSDLTSGGAAEIALGVVGSTSLFLAATTATALDADEYWLDTTPVKQIAIPAAFKEIVIATNIIVTVTTAAVTGGVIIFDVLWRPASPGATLVAA